MLHMSINRFLIRNHTKMIMIYFHTNVSLIGVIRLLVSKDHLSNLGTHFDSQKNHKLDLTDLDIVNSRAVKFTPYFVH